jgi:hypothetical protein
LAAWNVQQYNFIINSSGKLVGKELKSGREFDVIFYHFHYLRFLKNNKIELGRRQLSDFIKEIFYRPYIKELLMIKEMILKINNSFDPNGATDFKYSWKTPILFVWRKLRSTYNIHTLNEFSDN